MNDPAACMDHREPGSCQHVGGFLYMTSGCRDRFCSAVPGWICQDIFVESCGTIHIIFRDIYMHYSRPSFITHPESLSHDFGYPVRCADRFAAVSYTHLT